MLAGISNRGPEGERVPYFVFFSIGIVFQIKHSSRDCLFVSLSSNQRTNHFLITQVNWVKLISPLALFHSRKYN